MDETMICEHLKEKPWFTIEPLDHEVVLDLEDGKPPSITVRCSTPMSIRQAIELRDQLTNAIHDSRR